MLRCKTLEAIGVWNFFTPCGVFTQALTGADC